MIDDAAIERLLRWRLERAEAEAPPPPNARELLEGTQPWWDRWPDRFRAHAARLRAIPVPDGRATLATTADRHGRPVPVLIARGCAGEAHADVAYFVIRNGRLWMRFALRDPLAADSSLEYEGGFEATFVDEDREGPVLVGDAVPTRGGEYRLEAELTPDVEAAWSGIEVTRRFPFRLILRPVQLAGWMASSP